jgi:hypothetical protein
MLLDCEPESKAGLMSPNESVEKVPDSKSAEFFGVRFLPTGAIVEYSAF